MPSIVDCYVNSSFIVEKDAESYFKQLANEVPWQQREIRMFGKVHPEPRLTAWMADEGVSYAYSGVRWEAQPWHPVVLAIRARIAEEINASFNAVLLNYYRDGSDKMGWHQDNEPELGRNPVIASVSLGAVRRFRMRTLSKPRQFRNFDLGAGSLLVMQGSTQHEWQHCLTPTKISVGPRINLTFRKIHSRN